MTIIQALDSRFYVCGKYCAPVADGLSCGPLFHEIIPAYRSSSGIGAALRKRLADDVQAVMSRPENGDPLLWREKAFDLVLDGKWISGIFDRVVIIKNDSGKAESAEIIDFKTGDVAPEVYAPQLQLYRRALAAITRLPTENISTTLLYTETGKAIPVE